MYPDRLPGCVTLMGWMSNLRGWAARQIAPRVPNESKASRQATAAVRAETAGGMARPVAVETPPPRTHSRGPAYPFPVREPSPAEKNRRNQQADLLESQLATSGPAGWVSDHAEEANQLTGWVYVAKDARATRVAAAEVEVYRRDPAVAGEEGKVPVRPDHPLCRLLRRPNPKYDHRGLLYRVEQQLRCTGTALIWMPKNGLGLPGRLWVLPTALARPQPPSAEYPEGAYQVSVISLTQWAFFGASHWNTPAGAPLTIDARDVVRISYPHPLTEADGLSPVNATGQAIDVARETEEAIWSIFQQGPMPSQVISIDKDVGLTPETADDLKSEIESNLGGSRNAGKVQVVQGAKVEKMTFPPTETIPPDLRNQNRDNVLAGDGVPAIVAGVADATSYSAGYAALQQFDENQIQPELDFLGGQLTIRLACRYGDDLEIVLKLKPLNDPELKLRTIDAKVASGCYRKNEIRAAFGDKPLAGPEGEEFAGAAPAPAAVPGLPGQPAPGPDGLPGDPDDMDLTPDEADADGTGQPDPARRAAPVEALNRLRGKGLAFELLPSPLWNGHQKHPTRG